MLDVLGVILALAAVLGLPVAIIVLLVGQSRLKRRVTDLERAMAAVEDAVKQRAVPQSVAPRPATGPVAETPREAPVPETIAAQEPDSAAPVAASSGPVVVGPWSGMRPLAEEPEPPSQNQPIVFRADRVSALVAWLRVNWFYAVSATSLALAGIFLVQYGIERGLVPPGLRVLAALALGASLVVAGEYIRRRWGDAPESATAYLPSVFSAAGVVTLFAAVLAARQLYGLVGPEVALAGLVAVSALAIGLGWRHGPLMAAMGLLGAGSAPFIVSGSGEAGVWLYGYFAVIAATGLAVDAGRRWAWISVLALAIGYGGGGLVLLAGAGTGGYVALMVGLLLLAICVPVLSLVPRHEAPPVLLARTGNWPVFPVRLAAGALVISTLGVALQAGGDPGEGMLAFAVLAGLALLLLLWADRAPGLSDLPGFPALVFLMLVFLGGLAPVPLARDYLAAAITLRPPETAPSMTATILLGLALAMAAGFALRALRSAGDARPVVLGQSLGAVALAPLAVLALHRAWAPGLVLGTGIWALHVMAVAGWAVALALAFAKADGEDHRRMAWAVLAALAMIALSLVLMLADTPLTLALAAMIAVAAALDRRFRLPEMGVAILVGLALVGWRFWGPVSQGWLIDGPLLQVLVTFGGVLAAVSVALWQIGPLDRRVPQAALEAVGLVLAGLLVNVLVERWLLSVWGDTAATSHWRFTLAALPWIAIALGLLHRGSVEGWLAMFHRALAGVVGAFAALLLGVGATVGNPLFGFVGSEMERVLGWPVLSSLFVGYGLPGLVLGGAAWKMPRLAAPLRVGLGAAGAALLALWVGLEIRHLWQGPGISLERATGQGELYSYSVALILLGAALMYQSVAARSAMLRGVGTGVIALAIAKVFLVDASGLSGLTRVASFLGLGLALAGLAWLNRWAGRQTGA